MTPISASHDRTSGIWKRASQTQILCVMLAAVIALQASMIPRMAINWDEFFFYHEVWQFAQEGTLNRAIQTLHVRVFSWITWLPGNAVDHIIAARLLMFSFELITIGSIYALARKFSTQSSALLCALAYVSFGFVFTHGFSFRTDPMAAAMLSGALAIFAWKRLSALWMLAIASLVALAFLTTIKSVLWAPAFAGIAWLRWSDAGFSRLAALRLFAVAVLVLSLGAAFYWLHSLPLDPKHLAATGASGKGAAQKMFSIGVQPYWRFIPKAFALGIVASLMMFAAPFNWRDMARPKWIALAGLWLPLTTFLFYHNTAAYFYAFILPPVIAAAAPVASKLLERHNVWLISLAMACAVPPLLFSPDPIAKTNQNLVIDTAGEMFAQPVAYFDYAYMLPGFAKKNGFMTPWGIESYLMAQRPIYADAMAQSPVPLVAENHAAWTRLLRTEAPAAEFLNEDAKALRETYINAWGIFWLAGLELDRGQSTDWTVRVPGTYQVKQGKVQIGKQLYETGAFLVLKRGTIAVASAGDTPMQLMWNEGLTLPKKPMADGPIWMDF